MDRNIETKEYRFNEQRHLHQLLVDGEWKNLTGCTTVLSVLAKPALIQWSANMAVEYIKNTLPNTDPTIHTGDITIHRSDFEKILEEAKTAHRKKKEKAGDLGTQIHAEVESIIKQAIQATDGLVAPQEGSPQINHFVKWAIDNKVKFLETEKCVYSKSLFLGGIVDIICEIDGQLWIADIKTGSGIYPEMFAQCSGYNLMLDEMGYPQIAGHIILNLKKTGEFDEKRSISTEDSKKLFLACLDIYRLQEKFNNQII